MGFRIVPYKFILFYILGSSTATVYHRCSASSNTRVSPWVYKTWKTSCNISTHLQLYYVDNIHLWSSKSWRFSDTGMW
jgi:hypothetical protein